MEQEKNRFKRTKREINSVTPLGVYSKNDKLRSLGDWELRNFEMPQGEARTSVKFNEGKSGPTEIRGSREVVRSKEIDRDPKKRNSCLLTAIDITTYANYVAYQVFTRPSQFLRYKRELKIVINGAILK